MPTEPPFDPSKHLPRPNSDQAGRHSSTDGFSRGSHQPHLTVAADDETFARMLQEQEQILDQNRRTQRFQEEDMGLARQVQFGDTKRSRVTNGLQEGRGQDIHDDLEYARRMQEQEMLRMSNQNAITPQSTRYQNHLDYARRHQERAFQELVFQGENSGGTGAARTSSTSSDDFVFNRQEEEAFRNVPGDSPPKDTRRMAENEVSDWELARRLQDLETSNHPLDGIRQGSDDLDPHRSLSDAFSQSSSQEEEDARLARLMAETGESLRTLDVDAIRAQYLHSSQPSQSPARPPHAQKPPSTARQSDEPAPPPAPPKLPPRTATTDSYDMPMPDRPTFDFDGSGAPSSDAAAAAASAARTSPRSLGVTQKPKKLANFLGFGKKANQMPSIPAPVSPPLTSGTKRPGPIPYSLSFTGNPSGLVDKGAQTRKGLALTSRSVCCVCGKQANSYLLALDKKYHRECFLCTGCHVVIDANSAFAYMTDDAGEKHPLHGECYAELYGVKCTVCRKSIPAGPDGRVSYVKHPFFDKEQMCPAHAVNPGRRCTGCHRFEPENEPFADLNDCNRCACYSCCRTVVVDSADAEPLWGRVMDFFEKKLGLPLWPDMRQVPVLVVGYQALNDQIAEAGGAHGGSSQIMTRGLCLTEHQSGRRLKLSKMKFDPTTSSFRALDAEAKGFTYFMVPEAHKVNPAASVTCILCLSGLPSDLTTSILAHEATHAWIKLHPQYDYRTPISPQVEEGVAQLVAMLYLSEGLQPASSETFGDSGPTEEKLRQYFKFSIETDDHEVYGEGFRKAAKAYADIGLEALLSHIVMYKEFPIT